MVPLGYVPVVDIGGSPPHTIDEMLRPISDTELMAMTVADLKAAIPLTSILIGSASPLPWPLGYHGEFDIECWQPRLV